VELDEMVVLGYGAKKENSPLEVEFQKIQIETTVAVKFALE
jgi:hypothetical protein